jgi:hypothetical protein
MVSDAKRRITLMGSLKYYAGKGIAAATKGGKAASE